MLQVSKPAWDYLRIMKEAGVIELLKYNPERWVADESWMEFVDTRKRLQSLLVRPHPPSPCEADHDPHVVF